MSHSPIESMLPELLGEAPFVSRLSEALCGSSADADDLAQETWLAALARPPRDGSSPRGFLGTVLRHRRANRMHAEARRAEHEAWAARRESQPGEQVHVDRIELQVLLLEKVRGLPEPQREVVLLRYYEGLGPQEIATRLGIGDSTVRSRLSRALDELRARLDAQAPGGRERWMAALAPLGGIMMTTKGAVGASLTMKKWILGVGLLVLGLAGAKWASDGAVPREPGQVQSTAMAPLVLEVGPAVPIAGPVSAAEQRTEVPGLEAAPAVAAAEGAELDVRAFWSDGEPAIGVRIVVGFREAGASRQGGRVREVEADGVARFRGLPARSGWVCTPRNIRGQGVALVAGERAEIDFMLRRGETLRGRVVDTEGRGIGGAQLLGRPNSGLGSGGVLLGHADAVGEFVLRDLGETAVVSARAQGYTGSLEVELEELGRGVDGMMFAELEVWRGEVAFGGLVLDPAGVPVADARVLLSESDGRAFEDGSGRGMRMAAPVEMMTDGDGRFTLFGGVRRGTAALNVQAPGWPELQRRVEVDGQVDLDLELRLEPGGSLVGRIVDGAGAPLFGVRVEAEPSEDPVGFAPGPELLHGSTDVDGMFRLDGVPLGPYVLEAGGLGSSRGYARVELVIAVGEQTCDLTLDPRPWILGSVVSSSGEVPAELYVVARGTAGDARSTFVDQEGAFVLRSLGSDTYTVEVVERNLPEQPLATLSEVRPSDSMVEFVLEDLQRDASISGRIEAATRNRFPGLSLRVQGADADRSTAVGFDHNGGAFELENLAGGTFNVWLEAGDRRLLTLSGQVLADGQRLDLGTLAAPPPGRAVLRFNVEPDTYYHLRLVRADGSRAALEWHEGEARSGELDPGPYRLEGFWEGRLVPDVEVRVAPGRDTVMDLELPVGYLVNLVGVPGLEGEGLYELQVLDSEGQTVHTTWRAPNEDGELKWSPTLPAGQYEWVVSLGGSRLSGPFEAGPGSGEGRTVVQLER